MENEILNGVAKDMEQVTKRLVQAQDLVDALKEAGEDTSKMESDMRLLQMRKGKWETMLKNRGVL